MMLRCGHLGGLSPVALKEEPIMWFLILCSANQNPTSLLWQTVGTKILSTCPSPWRLCKLLSSVHRGVYIIGPSASLYGRCNLDQHILACLSHSLLALCSYDIVLSSKIVVSDGMALFLEMIHAKYKDYHFTNKERPVQVNAFCFSKQAYGIVSQLNVKWVNESKLPIQYSILHSVDTSKRSLSSVFEVRIFSPRGRSHIFKFVAASVLRNSFSQNEQNWQLKTLPLDGAFALLHLSTAFKISFIINTYIYSRYQCTLRSCNYYLLCASDARLY